MAEVGIEIDDVAKAIAEDQLRQESARYRSATGDTWSGDGEMPQWLCQALSAGQSLEHFAADRAVQPSGVSSSQVDWRQDPFAGSRLATVGHAPRELR
ncbi:H-NS histone family protein [Paraburkholderia sp. CNPSo 3157]|uniref:H-NS histone family protein n=1 Tax=Paraburkholderia franconis TaxID=2654983 RepID=A0A7X1NAW1_9BURK|nr:H-NS histone family protein [Paraburkholderia franconis]